jgi:hypothetical protein
VETASAGHKDRDVPCVTRSRGRPPGAGAPGRDPRAGITGAGAHLWPSGGCIVGGVEGFYKIGDYPLHPLHALHRRERFYLNRRPR